MSSGVQLTPHILHDKLAEHASCWEDAVNSKQEYSAVWLKVWMQALQNQLCISYTDSSLLTICGSATVCMLTSKLNQLYSL